VGPVGKRILNLSSALAIREAGPATAVFDFLLSRATPSWRWAVSSTRIPGGIRQLHWDAAGNLLGFVGLLVVVHFRTGLGYLVLAVAGAPVLTGMLNKRNRFRFSAPLVATAARSDFACRCQKDLQLGVPVLGNADVGSHGLPDAHTLIIAQVLGGAQVTEYAVALSSLLLHLLSCRC
jgi:hypothetical protein